MNDSTKTICQMLLPAFTASVLNFSEIRSFAKPCDYSSDKVQDIFESSIIFADSNSAASPVLKVNTDEENFQTLKSFSEKLIRDSVDLDPEIARIVHDNFYDLL